MKSIAFYCWPNYCIVRGSELLLPYYQNIDQIIIIIDSYGNYNCTRVSARASISKEQKEQTASQLDKQDKCLMATCHLATGQSASVCPSLGCVCLIAFGQPWRAITRKGNCDTINGWERNEKSERNEKKKVSLTQPTLKDPINTSQPIWSFDTLE